MASEDPLFRESLEKLVSKFKSDLDRMIVSISTNSIEHHIEDATRLSKSGHKILEVFANHRIPGWVHAITKAADELIGGKTPHHCKLLLEEIVRQHHKVGPFPSKPRDQDLDFDAMFIQFRDEGKLPQLFDKLIDILTKIIESNTIDSIVVHNTVSQLLASLKQNKNGSFAAVKSTVCRVAFFRNVLVAAAKKVPGLDVTIEAYKMTADEIEKEQKRIEEKLFRDQVQLTFDSSLQTRIEQMPPLAIEGPTDSQESGEDVIDVESETITHDDEASNE